MTTIMYFSAAWCGPCKVFGPVMDSVSQDLGISVQRIDVDASRDLADKYQIRSVPTLIFERDGEIVHRQMGAMGKQQLVSLIQSKM